MTRVVAIVACVAAVAGCMRLPYVQPAPNGAVISNARLGLYTKEVVTKKDPDTFLADDATICRVSPDLYKSTRLHSMVYCNWQ